MHLLRLPTMFLMLVLAAALFVACGDDEGNGGSEATSPAAEGNGESPEPGGNGDVVELEITAENNSYDESELIAPAGSDVLLIFDNDDDGIQHNWSLYEDESGETVLFEGRVITGVEQIEYEFTAPDESGTNYFQCDIHPSQMNGDFIVE